MQMALTDQDKLKQVALLLADVVDLLAPLIGATQPHLGQFGGVIHRPTPLELEASLHTRANELRQLYSTDTNHPDSMGRAI